MEQKLITRLHFICFLFVNKKRCLDTQEKAGLINLLTKEQERRRIEVEEQGLAEEELFSDRTMRVVLTDITMAGMKSYFDIIIGTR